jgi:hypothetical protein
MAAAAAEAAQRLREAVNDLVVGRSPPSDFPGRLATAPAPTPYIDLDEIQKQRFFRNKFLAEFAGLTTADAIVGNGQVVIIKVVSHGTNFYCLSEGTEKQLDMVDQDHVSIIDWDVHSRAWDRFAQVNALTSAETKGYITHAEADMAARHFSAHKAALRVCQEHRLYYNEDLSSALTPGAMAAREEANNLLDRFNERYEAQMGKDVFAHALSFYNTHRLEFPQEFDEDQHIDWFIVVST